MLIIIIIIIIIVIIIIGSKNCEKPAIGVQISGKT